MFGVVTRARRARGTRPRRSALTVVAMGELEKHVVGTASVAGVNRERRPAVEPCSVPLVVEEAGPVIGVSILAHGQPRDARHPVMEVSRDPLHQLDPSLIELQLPLQPAYLRRKRTPAASASIVPPRRRRVPRLPRPGCGRHEARSVNAVVTGIRARPIAGLRWTIWAVAAARRPGARRARRRRRRIPDPAGG